MLCRTMIIHKSLLPAYANGNVSYTGMRTCMGGLEKMTHALAPFDE